MKFPKVKVRFKKLLDAIKYPDGHEMAKQLDRVAKDVVVPIIMRGLSPIRGARNFPKYKNKDKYPGDLKPSNKPNLYLTGEMLKTYSGFQDGRGARMGIPRSAPDDVKARAEANNVGLNGIPARRFVPLKGEKFNLTVTREIKDALAKVIFTRYGKGK